MIFIVLVLTLVHTHTLDKAPYKVMRLSLRVIDTHLNDNGDQVYFQAQSHITCILSVNACILQTARHFLIHFCGFHV